MRDFEKWYDLVYGPSYGIEHRRDMRRAWYEGFAQAESNYSLHKESK